ncbi:MAG: class I SAM-dependent methyltransferase [Coriobacteriia bacterium]|nr:class I SAM-dependent methyltransferase [Coriobacteriia bacterium]
MKHPLTARLKPLLARTVRFRSLRQFAPYAIPGVPGLLEQIETVRRRMHRVRSLEELEKKLPPNEMEEHRPCPLCGAREVRLMHRALLWGYRGGRCPGCGLLYRVPAIKPERVTDLYTGGDYAKFLEGGYQKGRRTQYKLTMATFAPLFDDGQGRRLLDFGCGTGNFVDLALGRGFDAVGVDLSPDAVQVARERLGSDRAYAGNPLEVPELAGGGFDVITLWSVLAHFAEPVRQLEEIRSLLAPDGMLLIYTVNAQSLELKAYGPAWPAFVKNHLIFWEPATLTRLLRRAGFQGVAFRPFYGTWIEKEKGLLTRGQRARMKRHIDRYQSGPMMRAVAINGPVESAGIEGAVAL